MKRKQPSPRDLAALCAEVQADDGVDPKLFFRQRARETKSDRKTMQLCRQIGETLSQVLAECGDEALRDLQVMSVVPAPDASQLLVLVTPAVAGGMTETSVMGRLLEAAGRLRTEVAAAITRRRAPKLVFQFVAGRIEGTHAQS
jgi:ribosome-binding factor A